MLQAPAIAFQFRPSTRRQEPVDVVRSTIERADDELDYAEAKLAFDAVVDPSIDKSAVLSELGRLTKEARDLAGQSRDADAKLKGLRRVIYESGSWNSFRPFEYDQSDPLGRVMRNKLLHNYLATRRGQCVSMPVLMLILADRLGLPMSLATAPDHVLVRYQLSDCRAVNLETTSGAHPAREIWYRKNFPITDLSLETGIYLRSLTRREAVAVMAMIVVEHLYKAGRHEEVMAVTVILLQHHPLDVNVILTRGSAAGKLLNELRQRFPHPGLAPPEVIARLQQLMGQNIAAFATAENLGWIPFEENH